MKHYVAGFMKDFSDNVALVRKNKPKWQAGRLNGVCGGIEDGETPLKRNVPRMVRRNRNVALRRMDSLRRNTFP